MGEKTTRRFWRLGGAGDDASEVGGSPEIADRSSGTAQLASVGGELGADIAGALEVQVGRRMFFRHAGVATAIPLIDGVGGGPKPVSGLRRLLNGAKASLPNFFRNPDEKIIPIPGISGLLGNLLSAESSLGELQELGSSLMPGQEGRTLSAKNIMARYASSIGLFDTQAVAIDGETRIQSAHILAEAEEIQEQLDAWATIMNSPLSYQIKLAQGQHKVMLGQLQLRLDQLGITQQQWERLQNDGFGSRILRTLLKTGREADPSSIAKNVGQSVEQEYGEVMLKTLKGLAKKAQWVVKYEKDPAAAAAFFKKAGSISDAIPVDVNMDGELTAQSVIDSAANSFFNARPDLKPKGFDEEMAKRKQQRETAKRSRDETALNAGDELVINDPEMGPWLIRARVLQNQGRSEEKRGK